MKSRIMSRVLGSGLAIGWMLLGISPNASARPGGGAASQPVIRAMNLRGEGSDLAGPGADVFQAAQAETTWFGGTVWAADSMRWEAILGGVWTFDSGVGSSMVPPGGPGDLSSPTREWVNPFKQPGLHASLEGWIGFDNTYSEIMYFRRLSSSDSRWGPDVCVGATSGLGGNYSYWCGVFPAEALDLCYVGGQGYGNDWQVCIERPFTYTGGPVALTFDYKHETEDDDYDYSTVYVDTSGNGTEVEVFSITGVAQGQANLPLNQGVELPDLVPASIKIKFCFVSDGLWSDQDGFDPTACGAFALDNVNVSGGGITHTADFESSDDGWVLSPSSPGAGGEWADLVHLSDLPPTMAACPCALNDSVLVFFDDSNGHGQDQDNLAASPWIDLKAEGLDGSMGKMLRTNIYGDLPLQNYIFFQFYAQWYPDLCPNTGKLITSPWTSNGLLYFFGQTPECSRGYPGTSLDYSAYIPPGAEQVRIAVGVKSFCRLFADCTQLTNPTPWFDEVRFGVYGSGPPWIAADPIDLPQDNFPASGALNLTSPGRVDCNRIQGDFGPEVGTSLGDTMVIRGGAGDAEVHVHFRVDPGPGVSPAQLADWWTQHPDSPYESGFKTARCDTAERGNSGVTLGRWMTTYHESDPNFIGTDRDIDLDDVTPNGGTWRLENDIFPDDLFTAGTRLDLFYTANAPGSAEYYRIPAAPQTYEMEILPSSTTVNTQWNCVLYVDHFGGGAQPLIESALSGFLGMSSENFEHTNWDRFDVNAASSRQMSFGRPYQTEYGATVLQALGYKVILWNTGDLNAGNLTGEDADVLNPWLTLIDFDFNRLYLSGDGLVFSATSAGADPSAVHLLEDLAGVGLRSECSQGTYRLQHCPTYGVPLDMAPCVSLQPAVNALVADSGGGRNVLHAAQGNGCPELRSFDVIEALTPDYGISRGDERYESPLKSARFASVATNATPSTVLHYKIVVDGVSVHYRRDEGTPCSYGQGGTDAIAERLEEVLTYFGFPTSALCHDITGISEEEPEAPVVEPVLAGISPNPLPVGSPGRIRFTLPREGRVVIGVYDLQGRLVKSVFDGTGLKGENEATWTGTDEAGVAVASGVYFLRLRAEGKELSTRVVVLRGGGS